MAQSILLGLLLALAGSSFRSAPVVAENLELVYQWTQLRSPISPDSSMYGSSSVVSPEPFNAYNNLPMGVTHHKGILYVTVPRREPGVASTLNIIDLARNPVGSSPLLQPFPNLQTNTLRTDYAADAKRLVSVYRTKVDICDRLWFVDTGFLEYQGAAARPIQRPSVWVVDIATRRTLRRYEIPADVVQLGYGIANIEVDVDPNDCNNAFAYLSDYELSRMYVYGLAVNRAWRVEHNYFSFEPRNGDFNVDGTSFVWRDGIFSVAVGGRIGQSMTERTVYLHAMASTSEITVSNKVLQNETLIRQGNETYVDAFRHLGSRGPNTQSNSHAYDPRTGILFYAEDNRNSIGCWNTNRPFAQENFGIVYLDNDALVYPSDLRIDSDGVLWVMSNRMPAWLYTRLNTNDVNFRIFRQTTVRAAAGTVCA